MTKEATKEEATKFFKAFSKINANAMFNEVDEDGNGRLDRDEIGALLKAITGKDPTRQGLDIVMEAAGGKEEEMAGGVTKENLLRALKKCDARANPRAPHRSGF